MKSGEETFGIRYTLDWVAGTEVTATLVHDGGELLKMWEGEGRGEEKGEEVKETEEVGREEMKGRCKGRRCKGKKVKGIGDTMVHLLLQ